MKRDGPDGAPGATGMSSLAVRRVYTCQCGRPIFFRNSTCIACGTPLGYDPQIARLLPLEPGPVEGSWMLFGSTAGTSESYARCANFLSAAPCNWLVPWSEFEGGQPMCRSCRLNRMIPDLSLAESALLWGRTEQAKRRLVSSLIGLRLPVLSRVSEDLQRGLAFDLLRSVPGGPSIMTGHVDGIITLNVDEADDAKRETLRAKFQEPYRTLLGHLRHEIGHYYWYRLVDGGPWVEPYREVFGDEREPYGAALAQHYQAGPRPDWQLAYVSAYASAHPWEDWAETWAHYLHMVDTLDTASSFGLDSHTSDLLYEPFTRDALWRQSVEGAQDFLRFVNSWVELSGVFNELSRSMGQRDLYPFVLPVAAIAKLQFVHLVVTTDGPPQAAPVVKVPRKRRPTQPGMSGKRQEAR
jgi:hypothetical protein